MDLVDVPPALLDHGYVPLFGEVLDDRVGGTFCDPNDVGNITNPDLRVLRDGEEDVAVVGEEPPRLGPLALTQCSLLST